MRFLGCSLVLGEDLRCITGVYNRRYYFKTPFFSIRLHHWLSSDDSRYLHDHPWWFITVVLKGHYTDVSQINQIKLGFVRDEVKAPAIRFRGALHRHWVEVPPTGCWSLLLTGPEIRRWGFWVGKRFMNSKRYFIRQGIHPCD